MVTPKLSDSLRELLLSSEYIILTLNGKYFEKIELEFFNGAQWIPHPRNVVKNATYMGTNSQKINKI